MKVIIEEIVSNNDVNVEDNSIIHIVHIEEFESVSNHSQLNLDDGTNPHGTTKQDVGLGNVPNLNTTDAVNKAHVHTNISILNGTEESFTTALKNAYNSAVSWITTNGANLINHLTNTSNPHNVTKSQVGLSSVDNTSDADKPISNATQGALNNKADLVGGKVPSSQLPSYVDDVLEFANLAAFPATGETGKIYLALDTNKTYRWGGSSYVQIGGGKRYQTFLFQSAGTTTLTTDQKNMHQSRFNAGASVFSTLGLTLGNGVPEPSGVLDLNYLSDVGMPNITPNYISKVVNVTLSYSRNVAESGAYTNIKLRLISDSLYLTDVQKICEHVITSNTLLAYAEGKITIPILTHLPLSRHSNLKWTVRSNNGVAQQFNILRLNVDIEEL